MKFVIPFGRASGDEPSASEELPLVRGGPSKKNIGI